MKKKTANIILILMFLAGLSLLLYPTVSDYWNSMHASQAVANYAEKVKDLSREQYDKMLQEAKAYNKMLAQSGGGYTLSKRQEAAYESILDVTGTGIMGYIEIPTIHISLPIYHGIEDSVLQIAVGHLEWSSLPVGGKSIPLCPLWTPGTAQRKALYQSGSARRRGYLCHSRSG